MEESHNENRSPVAIAYLWASRVLTVSLEMVLPGLAGVWLDAKWDWAPVLTVLGFAGGLVLGVWHLLVMTSERNQAQSSTSCPKDGEE
ncbi:MAG: AtpZ/AtpI family protein [Aeoliella sp.]